MKRVDINGASSVVEDYTKANIIVMGKTGAGKSTIINALLGEEVAEVGIGQAVTKVNKTYNKKMSTNDMKIIELSLYDTVGLEIDSDITKKTLSDIKKHMKFMNDKCVVKDVSAVWFCINNKCNRFEKYELELLERLSVDSCIPFIIVITQCLDDVEGELEKQIRSYVPEISIKRILAQDYRTRVGISRAYGLSELLDYTIKEYPKLKISLATSKIEHLMHIEKEKNERMENMARKSILSYVDKAKMVGWLPGICIPYVHSLCIMMIAEINKVYEISLEKDASDILVDAVLGIVATPFMTVPILSRAVTEAYIQTVGDSYLDAVKNMVERHSNYKIESNMVILEEIKKNLKEDK